MPGDVWRQIAHAAGSPFTPIHDRESKQFAIATEALAEAEKGMAEMSKLYSDTGRQLYLGADGREHD